MGLTFHFELRLPADTTEAELDDVLARLKRRAEELHFADISETFISAVDYLPDPRRHFFNILVDCNASSMEFDERPFSGEPDTARGFIVDPGKGCEWATFAFLRRTYEDDGSSEWHWLGHCKTQYASQFGEQHFVDCHLRLVAMLDFAKTLGIDVTVYDEGDYWESRDRDRLVAELDKMNRLIARMAGTLHDHGHSVESPIFDYRDFEQLEG